MHFNVAFNFNILTLCQACHFISANKNSLRQYLLQFIRKHSTANDENWQVAYNSTCQPKYFAFDFIHSLITTFSFSHKISLRYPKQYNMCDSTVSHSTMSPNLCVSHEIIPQYSTNYFVIITNLINVITPSSLLKQVEWILVSKQRSLPIMVQI